MNDTKSNDSTPKSSATDSASVAKPISLNDLRSRIEEYVKSQHRDPNYDWVRFYRYNYIKPSAFVTRAKIYQTAFAVGVFGWSVSRYMNNLSTWDELLKINCLTGFALVVLVVMGNLARRVVGICYADAKHPDLVRISHLSFFGRRIDRVVKLKDISALSDTNAEKNPLFFRLVVKIDGKNQTFLLANSQIAEIDYEVYGKVFGSLK